MNIKKHKIRFVTKIAGLSASLLLLFSMSPVLPVASGDINSDSAKACSRFSGSDALAACETAYSTIAVQIKTPKDDSKYNAALTAACNNSRLPAACQFGAYKAFQAAQSASGVTKPSGGSSSSKSSTTSSSKPKSTSSSKPKSSSSTPKKSKKSSSSPTPSPPPAPKVSCSAGDCDLIAKYVNPAINLMSVLFGLIAVISLILGSINYITSEGDPQKVSSAKSRLTNTIFAIMAYALLYSFLQFLVPGGIFH